MRRAVRFDNADIQKEISSVDTTVIHNVKSIKFLKNYNNTSVTENGAVGFRTTTHPLVDLNFKVSSLRYQDEKTIVDAYVKAYYEDKKYAIKWLFFLRDILEGLGERRTFRVCLNYLAVSHPNVAIALMPLVPEYGRFDDLLTFIDSPLRKNVCKFIKVQLEKDLEAVEKNQPVTLLAKWLPSNNTSSKKSRTYAAIIAKELGYSDKKYRKTLARLRAYSDVLEVKLSASKWAEVAYEKVPAKANLKYDNAFFKHDEAGRIAYLKNVLLGESNLNAKGLAPYEIVYKITKNSDFMSKMSDNVLAELMWQKIREDGYTNQWGLQDCIVVADGSGSMYSTVSGSSHIRAIDVCNSLAIYFAEQLKGVFHNKAITFSGRPEFIDLEQGKSLKDKLEIMSSHCEVANTNIEAVFDMLLAMAVSNQVPAEELPKQVLVISDMEFDQARRPDYWCRGEVTWNIFDEKLFDVIAGKYAKAGYAMPRLIFWNVCGRTNTIPMVDNESGICLLSGFSQNAMKVAGHKETKDPYESLKKTLDSARYTKVEEAYFKAVKRESA